MERMSADTVIKQLQVIIDKLKSNEISLINFQQGNADKIIYLEINFKVEK